MVTWLAIQLYYVFVAGWPEATVGMGASVTGTSVGSRG